MTDPALRTEELAAELLRLSRQLEQGLSVYVRAGREYAEAENAYRASKARTYLALDEGTVAERQARVDAACGEERLRKLLAEANRDAAHEAVRSRRAQLSALQTVARAARAEVEMAHYGPQEGP